MNITEDINNLESIEDNYYTYHQFFEDSWDFVSEDIVDDTFYENNLDFIKEITFDFYNQYESANKLNTKQKQLESAKEVGKLFEIFFSKLIKYL